MTAVQLVMVCVFAALYAATPPDFSPDAPVQGGPAGAGPVWRIPPRCGFYFAVTGQLRRAYWPSVVAEMAVLLRPWAYHVQYEQPCAVFALKSTEFAYVSHAHRHACPALRAALGGVVRGHCRIGMAALPGLTLSTRAEQSSDLGLRHFCAPPRSIWQRTGQDSAIVPLTALLAMALARARRLLDRQCRGAVATADLSLFRRWSPGALPNWKRSVGGQGIAPGGDPLPRPARIHQGCRSALSQPTHRPVGRIPGFHGSWSCPRGSIDKFMGDGILASFGAVAPDPEYAANALRAVDATAGCGSRVAAAGAVGGASPEVGAGLAA